MSLANIDNLPNDVSIGDPNHEPHHDIIHQGLKSLKTLAESTENTAVKLTGDQTIAGVKVFSNSPVVPTPTLDAHAANKQYVDTLAATKEPYIAPGSTTQYWRGDKTWQTLNKAAVGLPNVDNTSDANKPVSTAMQTALNGKENNISTGIPSQYYRGDKTWQTLNKAAVGLGNVDNTADIDKPISSTVQTALNGKENTISTGTITQYYRGDKTWATLDKAAAGLGNVDNTTDMNKPVSTAMQTALSDKANISDTMTLLTAQTASGAKTFTGNVKFGTTTTVGFVWTANATDGSGSWQKAGTPATQVDWTNVLNKPATFPPTIGTTSATAAAGDHTHTKAQVGLGNVDNTSDANKPVSTATQTALNAKVPTTRTITAVAPLTGGGTLNGDINFGVGAGSIDLPLVSDAVKTESIPYVQTLGTRSIGYGDLVDGVRIPYGMKVVSVRYRMGTVDGSGTTTVELRKNGSAIVGTSGTASVTPNTITGNWPLAEGDLLTVYITAVGTTPGKRLTADIVVVKA